MSKKQKVLDAPFTKHLSKSGETHGGHVYWVKPDDAADFDVFYEEHYEMYDNGQSSVHTTLASAVSACTANVGDVIYVSEGYTLSITGAAGLALGTAGISVIGLGVGDTRPAITFASTDNSGTMTMASDDVAFKNFVLICNDDALTNALVVTGDNCDIDIEFQDTSATVEAATAVRLDTANNCKLKLKYLGFTAGNAVVAAVRLDNCANVRIDIDAYGVNTNAWVEMVDVASTNVLVTGSFYTNGVTDLSQNVLDTVTGSTWFVVGNDGSAGAEFSGGSGNAIAAGDLSVIAAGIVTIDGYHDVGVADAVTNAVMSDVTGNKEDAAAAGAVSTTESLMAYAKQNVTAGIAAQADLDKLDAATLDVAPIAGSIGRFLASGGTALGGQLPDSFSLLDMQMGQKVSSAAADVLDGTQTALFTVAGGRVEILRLVSEVSVAAVDGGASNTSFVTNPTVGTDAPLCAVLDINADENGTIYSCPLDGVTALDGGSGGGAAGALSTYIAAEGTIDILSAADVGTGGALLATDLWWRPIDTGATVVAI